MIQALEKFTIHLNMVLLSIKKLSKTHSGGTAYLKENIMDGIETGYTYLKSIQYKLVCNLLTYYNIVLKLEGTPNLTPKIINTDLQEIKRYKDITYFACNLFEEYLEKSVSGATNKKNLRNNFYKSIISNDLIDTVIQNYYIFDQQVFQQKLIVINQPQLIEQGGGLQLLNNKKYFLLSLHRINQIFFDTKVFERQKCNP